MYDAETVEMIKSGDWLRGLSNDALERIYSYYERNYSGTCEEITYLCPHCGVKHPVTGEAYQVDSCDIPIYYDVESGEAYLDWDNSYIEADFNYVCSNCGADLGFSSLQELGAYHKGNREQLTKNE